MAVNKRTMMDLNGLKVNFIAAIFVQDGGDYYSWEALELFESISP